MIYIDQINSEVNLHTIPKRIISLVPSQTELLYDLGIDKELVGITKFCIHPKTFFNSKTKVGGTKNNDFEKIDLLNPDLVIANKEENTKENIEKLKEKYPVWVSDVSNLESALDMISKISEIVNKKTEGLKLVTHLKLCFDNISKENIKKKRVLYLIWNQPYISIGYDTFIHDMIQYCGFENVLKDVKRYPKLTVNEINRLNPEYILLSSEPYPFKEKHLNEFKVLFPNVKIKLVDGEMFSWYGSRLKRSPLYFYKLIEEISSLR